MVNRCIYIRNTRVVEAQVRRKSVTVKENSEVNPSSLHILCLLFEGFL